MRILVLGGRGFIGRHVVSALDARGHEVVVSSRRAARGDVARSRERRSARFERLIDASTWRPLLADIEVVVNCVGILRERRGESYDVVHHRAPAALAAACLDVGIARLVHVSALGLDERAANGFLTSKRAGERALPRPGLSVTIVRPSLLDGNGGFGARWLRLLARSPIHFVPDSARGRIAALDVVDLGIAIARLCELPRDERLSEVELGGIDQRTFAEHLQALRRLYSAKPAWSLRIPDRLASLVARFCDAIHFSPFSVGHLELLGRDNVPKHAMLEELLGRIPARIGRPPAMSGFRFFDAAPADLPSRHLALGASSRTANKAANAIKPRPADNHSALTP